MANGFLSSLGQTCPKCDGEGVLPAGRADEDVLICPTCEGDGVVMVEVTKIDHVEQPCDNPHCDKGKVKQVILDIDGIETEVMVECPVCLGLTRIVKDVTRTYEEAQNCPTCKGDGQITMKELRKRGAQVLCDMCKGLGVIPNKKKLGSLAFVVGMIILMPIPSFIVLLLGFMGYSVLRTLKKDKGDKPQRIKRERRK